MRLTDVAAAYGVNERSLSAWRKVDGKLPPSFMVGNKRYWKRIDVEAHIEANKRLGSFIFWDRIPDNIRRKLAQKSEAA